MATGWEDLRLLLAVVRGGTLTAAARDLGVSQPTLSRRMAALARRHGEALVAPVGGRWVLTAAGRSVAARAERLEGEIDALASELDHLGGRAEGAVRLTAPEGLALAVIAPRLEAFRRSHPEIDLLLAAETPVVNLARREADLALRFVRPVQRQLVVRKVASVPFFLCASARTPKDHPGAAAGAPDDVVALHESMEESPESVWLRTRLPEARVRVRVHSTLAVRAAILAGAGVGVLPQYLADDPGLRTLGPPALRRDVFLVVPGALRASARVRAVGAFAAECVTASLG